MRSLAKRRVHQPSLEARFELPDRPRPRLPAWLATGVAFALAGPAFLIPGVAMLFASTFPQLHLVEQLATVTMAGAAWTLVSWSVAPFVLRARGYPAVVARRVERRWLAKNAKKLVDLLHPEEQVLDVAGVHRSAGTEGSRMAIYVLTTRRVLIVRTAGFLPFSRRLPIAKTISLAAIGGISSGAAGILRRAQTLLHAHRGGGLLTIGVLSERELRLRFASVEEAQLAERLLAEAMRSGATAGPGALAISTLDDERGALALAGSEADAGALSPVLPPEKSGSSP